MAGVTLKDVRKVYPGGFEAVKGITFDVPDGHFCVLVGPSGCGKSTLLRMIAGGDSQNRWNLVMATAILAMIPPALVVILMQKWFVKGLVDTEK